MSDRIIIEIDDESLNEAIAKFDEAIANSITSSGGSSRTPRGRISAMDRIYAAGIGYERAMGKSVIPDDAVSTLKDSRVLESLRNLPTMDRNMRVIINQVPGGRMMSQGLFRAKYIGRMMNDFPIETAMILGATALMIAKWVNQTVQGVQRERQQYKDMISDYQPTLTKSYIDKWVSEREDWWRRYITG
jgi:hypothetical protein